MSVLSELQRRATEWGLYRRLAARLTLLSIISGLAGLLWLCVIPLNGQYRQTYISENALMPSQAYSYFRETEWNIVRGIREEIEARQLQYEEKIANRVSTAQEWLTEYGAKTAVFESDDSKTVYGVFHAPRGDGTEAIVLALPWYNSDNEFNCGGVALGLALARYFSRWPIWSKNIIIVLSENSGPALRSWVNAYHSSLDLTGGSIEAAIVLDYASSDDHFQHMEISYNGLNGELPNLDLVNIAISITLHEGMRVSLHGIPYEKLDQINYFTRIKTMILGIRNWAFAGARKIHGNEAFSGWRIQSVTLKAIQGEKEQHDITTMGRVTEAMFRAINNLLEKFHQSFFFYLLLSPRNFVSISSYLPSAIALALSYALASFDAIVNNAYKDMPFFVKHNMIAFVVWFLALLVSYTTAASFIVSPNAKLLVTIFALFIIMTNLNVGFRVTRLLAYRFQALGYIYMCSILSSLLMVNFALALTIGILAFPMVFVKITDANTAGNTSLRNLLLICVTNPFISLIVFTNLLDSELTGFAVLKNLVFAWTDLHCWTWFVICMGWLPSWILITLSVIPSTPQDEFVGKKNI